MTENDFSNDALLELEQTLKSRLKPIEPSQKFIGSLRSKLEGSTIAHKHHRIAITMLTIAGGLIIGLAIFLIGRGYLLKNGET